MKKVALDFVLSAQDRFSRTFNAFNARMEAMGARMEKVQGVMRRVSEGTGLNALAGAIGGVGHAAEDAVRKSGEFFSFAGRGVAGLLSAAGMAGMGMAGFVKSMAGAAAEAENLSAALGVSSQDLQKLSYAAGSVNVEGDAFHDMLSTLTEKMVESAKGSEELTEMFSALGVSVRKSGGGIKSSSQVMMEIADAFAAMADGSVKTKLAIELFGDEGKRLIPLLNQGSAAISAMGKEAEDMGLVFDKVTMAAGQEFSAALSKTQMSLLGLSRLIGKELLPLATPMINAFHAWIDANRELAVSKVVDMISRFAAMLPPLAESVMRVGSAVHSAAAWFAETVGPVLGLTDAADALAALFAVKMLSSVLGLAKAFGALSLAMMATPAGWITAALAAIGAAGFALWKNWGKISSAMKGMLQGMGGFFQGLGEKAQEACGGMALWAEKLMQAWQGVGEFFSSLWQKITGMFERASSAIGGMAGKLSAAAGKISGAFSRAGSFFGLGGGDAAEEEGGQEGPASGAGAKEPLAGEPSPLPSAPEGAGNGAGRRWGVLFRAPDAAAMPDGAWRRPFSGSIGKEAMKSARGAGAVQRTESVERTELVIRAARGTEIVKAPKARAVTVERSGMGFMEDFAGA